MLSVNFVEPHSEPTLLKTILFMIIEETVSQQVSYNFEPQQVPPFDKHLKEYLEKW